MEAREEAEGLERELLSWDAELVLQFSHGSPLRAQNLTRGNVRGACTSGEAAS